MIRGHVQGVFFRDSVRRLAERGGVTGRVANRRDGAVEAVFEGDPEEVERLIDFCRQGPRGARVDGVTVSEEEPEGQRGFEVR